MLYPVVNNRALGRASLFQGFPVALPAARPFAPQQSYAPQGYAAAPAPALGQAESDLIASANARLQTAQGVFDRVEKTYANLVAATDPDSARAAWEQARASMDAAQAAYDDAVRSVQGGRA